MDRRTLIAVGLSVVVIVGSLLIQTFLFPAPDDALGLGGSSPAPATDTGEPATATAASADIFAPVASTVTAAGRIRRWGAGSSPRRPTCSPWCSPPPAAT